MMNMGYSPWSGDRPRKPVVVVQEPIAEETKEDGTTEERGVTESNGTERTSKDTEV